MKIGDYVIVTKKLDPWESSGESEKDLQAYIGHVGVVIEVNQSDDLETALIRFPSYRKEHETGQRQIELNALAIVSSPRRKFPRHCYEN